MIRLILTGLILLMLSGCFALSKEQYESVESLDNNYKALEAQDRQLSQQLDHVNRHQADSDQSQEH